jgi:hypothetical protein
METLLKILDKHKFLKFITGFFVATLLMFIGIIKIVDINGYYSIIFILIWAFFTNWWIWLFTIKMK